MNPSRRRFMAQSTVLVPAGMVKGMSHPILLRDSIFDNGSHAGGKPDVIAQASSLLPIEWKTGLRAVDDAGGAGIRVFLPEGGFSPVAAQIVTAHLHDSDYPGAGRVRAGG